MAGLNLLTDDIFKAFPPPAQQSSDPEWRAFADIINDLKEEACRTGNADGSLSVEHLDDIFKCEKIPRQDLVGMVAEMLNTRVFPNDSVIQIQRRICSATATNRLHGTIVNIKDVVEECLGFRPSILSIAGYAGGWDEDDTIHDPPTQAEFFGGHIWDEVDDYVGVIAPSPFIWTSIKSGILIDIKNDGNYTLEQYRCALGLIAELKDAGLQAEIGYFDSGSGDKVIVANIYTTQLLIVEGDTQVGSPIITNMTSTLGINVGDIVYGPTVPDGALVLTVDSPTQITLDTNCTVASTGEIITFQPPIGLGLPDPGI